MPLEGFAEAVTALEKATATLKEARAAGAKGTIRTAQQAARLAVEAAQALDAIQTDTPRSRRADFHSFRRAFNAALGVAGVNVQQAMALASHKDTRTHLRYVDLSQGGPIEPRPLRFRSSRRFCPGLGLNCLPRIGPNLTIRLFLLVTPTRIELVLSA